MDELGQIRAELREVGESLKSVNEKLEEALSILYSFAEQPQTEAEAGSTKPKA